MDGTAEGLLASRRIFDEAISRFDRAMGTSLGGAVPTGSHEASAGSAVQSHRPSSSVVSERYAQYQLTAEGGAACAVQLELLASLAQLRALTVPAAAAAAAAEASAPASAEAEESAPALPPDFRFELPGGVQESERHATPNPSPNLSPSSTPTPTPTFSP